MRDFPLRLSLDIERSLQTAGLPYFFWKKILYNLCKQRGYLTFFEKKYCIIYANSGFTLLFWKNIVQSMQTAGLPYFFRKKYCIIYSKTDFVIQCGVNRPLIT